MCIDGGYFTHGFSLNDPDAVCGVRGSPIQGKDQISEVGGRGQVLKAMCKVS